MGCFYFDQDWDSSNLLKSSIFLSINPSRETGINPRRDLHKSKKQNLHSIRFEGCCWYTSVVSNISFSCQGFMFGTHM